MKATPIIEKLIYLLVILLSLAILTLIAISPAAFLDVSSIYKGF
jgi:hypothetical protein